VHWCSPSSPTVYKRSGAVLSDPYYTGLDWTGIILGTIRSYHKNLICPRNSFPTLQILNWWQGMHKQPYRKSQLKSAVTDHYYSDYLCKALTRYLRTCTSFVSSAPSRFSDVTGVCGGKRWVQIQGASILCAHTVIVSQPARTCLRWSTSLSTEAGIHRRQNSRAKTHCLVATIW
jgi:hypothetical protein